MRSKPTLNPEPGPPADTSRRVDVAGEPDRAGERRPEPVIEAASDDRGLEESGYGYGV